VKKFMRSGISALAMAALFGGMVFAHHGRAGYGDQITTVKGTVTGVQWKNPHVFLEFEGKDDKGKTVGWLGELSSPATMMAAGMSRTTLKPGDEIVLRGKIGQGGDPVILIDSITKDGKAIVGDPSAEGRFIQNTR
jgi:hypothetical protein